MIYSKNMKYLLIASIQRSLRFCSIIVLIIYGLFYSVFTMLLYIDCDKRIFTR